MTKAQKQTAYERRKDEFETDLKLVIRKHFERGNEAMGEDGGWPPDYGFLDDEDMGQILAKAASAMNGENRVAPGDYLFHHPPLPKKTGALDMATKSKLEIEIVERLEQLDLEDSVAVVEVIQDILEAMLEPNLATLNHAVAAELSRRLHGGSLRPREE